MGCHQRPGAIARQIAGQRTPVAVEQHRQRGAGHEHGADAVAADGVAVDSLVDRARLAPGDRRGLFRRDGLAGVPRAQDRERLAVEARQSVGEAGCRDVLAVLLQAGTRVELVTAATCINPTASTMPRS